LSRRRARRIRWRKATVSLLDAGSTLAKLSRKPVGPAPGLGVGFRPSVEGACQRLYQGRGGHQALADEQDGEAVTDAKSLFSVTIT
jgi:hypothetical protein